MRKVITNINELNPEETYSYADYLLWQFKERVELTKEMSIKFDLYQENKVREYWMADTTDKAVFIYVLEQARYIGLKPFTEDSMLQSSIFSELKFVVADIFFN